MGSGYDGEGPGEGVFDETVEVIFVVVGEEDEIDGGEGGDVDIWVLGEVLVGRVRGWGFACLGPGRGDTGA